MKFGLFTGMGGTTWEAVQALWKHIETTGWDAAAVTDHFMPNTPERTGDMLECWTTLAALSAVVPRLRIGTIVSGNTYRHPAVVAKMAAQVDIISGGRLICGMGAAWQENEHQAYGIPFYTVGERLARLDEACHVMKALWTQDKARYKGRYYQLDDAPLSPKPVQRPHPELMNRRRRREGDAADHRAPRRPLERVGGSRSPARQGRDPRPALRDRAARSQDDHAVGQHGARHR
jgi:alkanesulfonate monooxygenase SsuD/methylene tetrahydromethanopterin reductase-like flavin-dependent oxidoreductase (luciferase family)